MEAKEVVNNLIALYREKKFAHAYLVETNNIQQCFEDIKKIVKFIFCNTEYSDGCLQCNLCHLIEENNLPSLIVIEPDGKSIKKEAIESLKKSFSTTPIYTSQNIYIIKYPEKMNDTAFNKMLKFLEEPEENIIGFFITENKDYIASTIVSRCELVKMMYNVEANEERYNLSAEEYKKYLELVNFYINSLENDQHNLVWYNNSVLVKELAERNNIIIFLKLLFSLFLQKINPNEQCTKAHQCLKIIEKYLNQLNYNVNAALLLDSLSIELGEVYGK